MSTGNTIIKVSRKGKKERHPDAEKGLLFGKQNFKTNRAYRNEICEDCGCQDKYVREKRCLSKIDCAYRQNNWEESGFSIPYWYASDRERPMTAKRLWKAFDKFIKANNVTLTPEEMDRQLQFFKERFGGA